HIEEASGDILDALVDFAGLGGVGGLVDDEPQGEFVDGRAGGSVAWCSQCSKSPTWPSSSPLKKKKITTSWN
uniref:hypothetical protein n=1 Tax=Xenorhabdus sp. Sc-CR9 TaxID=2584468 RepID=UPI001F17E659